VISEKSFMITWRAGIALFHKTNMIKPTKGNILIEPTDVALKAGNFDLPDREKDATEGKVIAIGDGIGQVKPGDYVFFSKYCINGREIKEKKQVKYVILKEDDILAIKK
jgi:co-chaperonin GroES (HSP10)